MKALLKWLNWLLGNSPSLWPTRGGSEGEWGSMRHHPCSLRGPSPSGVQVQRTSHAPSDLGSALAKHRRFSRGKICCQRDALSLPPSVPISCPLVTGPGTRWEEGTHSSNSAVASLFGRLPVVTHWELWTDRPAEVCLTLGLVSIGLTARLQGSRCRGMSKGSNGQPDLLILRAPYSPNPILSRK